VNEARREREERGSQEGEGGERMLQSKTLHLASTIKRNKQDPKP
jgi:hypothetical protein